ncbi:MAG: glycosyltransferase [Candidatus Helarchaeota archaeon]
MKKLKMLMLGLDYNAFIKKMDGFIHRLNYYTRYFDIYVLICSPYKYKLKNISKKNIKIYFTNAIFKYFHIFKLFLIYLKISKKNKFDLITTQDPFITGFMGLIIKKISSVPLNVQIHANFINNPYWLKESIINYLLNFIGIFVLKRCDTIRVVTNLIKYQIRKISNINSKIIKNIPVFIDPNTYKIQKKKVIKMNNLKKDNSKKIKFFSLGRLVKQKNFLNLIKAADLLRKNYKDFIIFIGGDGPQRKILQKEVKKRNLEEYIKILGFLNEDEKNYYFKHSDVFISSSNYEGLGIVKLEAALYKKPIITTKTCLSNEIIIDGYNGFLVEIDKPFNLYEKMAIFINNKKLINKLGENAYNSILNNYNKDLLLKKLINFWKFTAKLKKS